MNIKVTADGTLGLYQEGVGNASPSLDVNSDVAVNIASVLTTTGGLVNTGTFISTGGITATASTSTVKLRDIQELTTPLTGATGATTHNAALARIFVHSSIAGAFTANFTNVGLTSGFATTLTLVLQQGGTARLPTMGTIDGTAVTFSWQGNITPVPTANRTDVVTFSVINSGGTYLVYGQLVSF
jgi:hypothetical protein